MQALDKQVADAGEIAPTIGFRERLEHVLAHDREPAGSNYEAMADGVEASGSLVRRCWKCRGTGVRKLSKATLDSRQKKIDELNRAIAHADGTDRKVQELQSQKREFLYRLNRESDCGKCNGIGWLETYGRQIQVDMFVTHQCRPCSGCGEILNEDLEDVCQFCGGDTYTVPVTAKPHCSSAGGSSWSGSSSTDSPLDALPGIVVRHSMAATEAEGIVEFGRVLRIVETVRKENAVLAAGIELFYGPEGARWAKHSWGRTFVLWRLTKAGIALARGGEELRSLRTVTDRITYVRLAESNARTPDVRRRALLRDADQQSRLLRGLVEAKVSEVRD